MTVESFLQLWSRHNTAIIEVLIALILISVVYLAFRTFFGPQDETGGAGHAAELEKTLQKILENQAVPAAAGAGAPAPAGAVAGGASGAEIDALKAELAAKEKALEALRTQGAAAPAADDGEKKKLDDRVKDLEARLAEYEIISEDIADLSFYKEENSKLQKELLGLKGGAPAAPEPVPAAAAAPAPEPAPEPAVPPPAPETAAAPAAAVAAAAPAPADPSDALKEMAAAAAGAPAATPPVNADDSKLMNQFEDFVKKG